MVFLDSGLGRLVIDRIGISYCLFVDWDLLRLFVDLDLLFPDISFLQYKDAKHLPACITYSMKEKNPSIFGQNFQINR